MCLAWGERSRRKREEVGERGRRGPVALRGSQGHPQKWEEVEHVGACAGGWRWGGESVF